MDVGVTADTDAPATRRAGPLALLARPRWAAVVAAVITVLLLVLFPKGEDAAAHLYQTQMWREHGWRFWDNNWYAGRYSQINYSLLYYPLAAIVSTLAVVVASVATSAATFAHIVARRWPVAAVPAAGVFTLLAPLPVLTGTYPFIFGLAIAFLVIAALQAERWWLAVGLTLVVALAHFLALLLLVSALVGLAIASRAAWRPGPQRRVMIAIGGIFAAAAVSWFAFRIPGASYPFELFDLAIVALYTAIVLALTWRPADLRPLRGVFAVYAVLGIGAFIIASPLGANVGRVLLYLGTPLLMIPLAVRGFRPRGLAAVLIAGTLVWQLFPVVKGVRTAQGVHSSSEEFWFPVEAFLAEHGDPNHRVGVVATDHHWEAFYLARQGVPLTRGWYRQDDFPANADLYGELTPQTYRTWLSRMAVRYVFLPEDRLDYSAEAESRLLREGGVLPQVADLGSWRVFEVPDPTPIATPAGRIEVRSIDAETVTLHVRHPGRYLLRLRYTPYWSVVRGDACVLPTSSWVTQLRVATPGIVTLRFRVGISRVMRTLLGRPARCDTDEFVGPLPMSDGAPQERPTVDRPSAPTGDLPRTSRTPPGNR